MVEYTIEQLVAKGLTEEEAKAYLETLKEKEKTTKIPFEIAKVFYSVDKPELVGHLVAGVEKDDDGEIVNVKYDFGTKPEIRVLKTMAQHTKYDATEGKVVVSSNIVPIKQSRKAIDLKTGKLITEMKKEIPDIPETNFDLDAESSFEEIKDLNPTIFRTIFKNDEIFNEIVLTIFPEKKTLKLLLEYFESKSKEKTIYKTLSELLKKRI